MIVMGYPLTFYSAQGLKDFGDGTYQAARAIGPAVIVRPEKRGDAGLIAHEVEHVKQWAFLTALCGGAIYAAGAAFEPVRAFWPLGGAAHTVFYAIFQKYRLFAEVRAYRRQLRYYPDDRREQFAKFLALRYGLPLTEAEAFEKLG